MMELLHNPAFVLFGILFIGILLGNIRFCGLTLGSSGVLFVALAAGHFGLGVPEGVGGIGTALFVYCVGLSAGNRFFSSLAQAGNRLALLSLVVVTLGALTAAGLSYAFGIGPGMAAGMFAGACTSTPALAATMESVPDAGSVNIGCGIAYPFGVAGVVLFVQLLPRLLKAELSREASAEENAQDPRKIVSLLVTIANPRIVGLRVADRDAAEHLSCRITRVVRGGRLVPVTAGDTFEEGLEMLLVGARGDLERDALMLGTLQENRYPMDSERERAEVIALDRRFCGRTLPKYGVTISRVSRLGFSFVPTADTEIIRNDVLTVVGLPEHIEGFKKVTGHRCTAMNATDMLSLAGGIALGILIGGIRFSLGDGASFSLGMAGGPLVVALVLGHWGRIGPIMGYIPRETRTLLMELGLVLFLAITGKTEARSPVVSYATAYPAALILMMVCAKIIIAVLG